MNTQDTDNSPDTPRPVSFSDIKEAESALQDLDQTEADPSLDAEDPVSDRRHIELDLLRERTAVRSAEADLKLLRDLAITLNAERDLRALSTLVLQAALRVFHSERGILFLGQGDERGLVPALGLNVKGEEIQSLELVSRTILRKGQQGEILITRDAIEDPRLRDIASVKVNQIRSVLCAPLLCRAGRIGAIYLDAPTTDAFPADAERLLSAFADVAAVALENARVHGEVLRENARFRRRQPPEETLVRIVGSTPVMSELRRRALVAAQMDSPMLIIGERGTGKELLARAIHDLSFRSLQPFVSFDCSAVAPEELKGLILGRVGPAATKSYSEENGVLAMADHGTLLLSQADRIDAEFGNELAKMLRNGHYRQMGSRRDLRLDVRLVLATARNLREAVLEGTFSQALYNKVNSFALRVPPLRERMSDLHELVAYFMNLHRDGRRHTPMAFSAEAIRTLEKEVWPGNVEELERVIHRAVLSTRKNIVMAAQVRRCFVPTEEHEALRYGPWTGRVVPLTTWEKEAIRQALTHTRGNRSEAARLLGVHRNTLVRKAREHGLD